MESSARAEDLLTDLVAIQSLPGSTREIAVHLASALDALGYETSIRTAGASSWADDPQGSPVPWGDEMESAFLIALPPESRDSGLLLFAHVDTEPLPQNSPVFSADAHRYFGHGIADDKAGCAAIVLAIENVVKRLDTRLPAVVFAPAKGGGSMGMSQAIRQVPNRTSAIYCHPAESGRGFTHIKTASRGVATFSFTIPGEVPEPLEENTPVSADPRLGASAIDRAVRFIAEMASWQDSEIVWLVTEIKSDGRDFQVPGACHLTVSSWFSTLAVDDVEAILINRVADFARGEKWSPIAPPAAVGLRANPAATHDEGFVRWAMEAISAVTSEPVTAYGWHSASDIRFPLLHLEIPAVGFGCLAGGFYGGEEWIDRASFSQFVAILELMMKEPWS